jgi:hypothetical protein
MLEAIWVKLLIECFCFLAESLLPFLLTTNHDTGHSLSTKTCWLSLGFLSSGNFSSFGISPEIFQKIHHLRILKLRPRDSEPGHLGYHHWAMVPDRLAQEDGRYILREFVQSGRPLFAFPREGVTGLAALFAEQVPSRSTIPRFIEKSEKIEIG